MIELTISGEYVLQSKTLGLGREEEAEACLHLSDHKIIRSQEHSWSLTQGSEESS
jgi:hypothetical protein